MKKLLALAMFLVIPALANAGSFEEKLICSTFRVTGAIKSGGITGTCFIVKEPGTGRDILVTAEHNFIDNVGEFVTIEYRKGTEDGGYKVKLPVKKDGERLWTSIPDRDIAAMYIDIPPEYSSFESLSVDEFAGEEAFSEGMHTGDTVRAIGFPYGRMANYARMPFLKDGVISSYPVNPVSRYPHFFIDKGIAPGCSGGPVLAGIGDSKMIVGIQVAELTQDIGGRKEGIGIGKIISSPHILKVIERLQSMYSTAPKTGDASDVRS